MTKRINIIWAVFCILQIINISIYQNVYSDTISNNVIITCDISKLPAVLPCLVIISQTINEAELINKLIPGKLMSDYDEINIMGNSIKRYSIEKTNGNTVLEFGPFGYVYFKQTGYIPDTKFLSSGRCDEIAENFIKTYFNAIPDKTIKKSKGFKNNYNYTGFQITYTKQYSGYQVLSTDDYLGDVINIKIYDNGDLEFERMWHDIEGESDLLPSALMPVNEVLNKIFNDKYNKDKLFYIQKIEIMYYLNPLEITSLNAFKPLYCITANGKYYYADAINGDLIPPVMKTARSIKNKPKKIFRTSGDKNE